MSQYSKLAAELEALAQAPHDELTSNPDRKRLLDAVRAIAPKLEKQEDVIQRVSYTPLELMAASIGTKMGLFKKLAETQGSITTDEIAKPLGADPVFLSRIIKFIATFQMVEEIGVGEWRASHITRILAHPGVEGGIFINFETLGPSWLAFPSWLESVKYQAPTNANSTAWKKGRNSDTDPFEFYRQNPDVFEQFSRFMTVQRYGQQDWLAAFPFKEMVLKDAASDAPVFVDVAGGVGHQTQALLKEYPELKNRVVLQDQADPIADALPVEGMQTMVIDLFKDQPVKNARAYYLRNILHDWTDVDCLTILKFVREAMGPQSLMLVDEMVIPDKGAHKIAMQIDMTMLANLNSEERSEERWTKLLGAAGLTIEKIFTYNHEVGDSIIVARPATT